MKRHLIRIRDLAISEEAVITVILINSIALSMSTSSETSLSEEATYRIDYICAVYFIVEVSLKILRDGWRTYWNNGWNRFDFVIVALSFPALLEPLGILDTKIFGVFLVLRLGRLFRLLRLLHFVPNRRHLITGIKRSLKASVGIFITLFIVNLIFSIGASMFFGKYAPDLFGNPALSFYNMFKVFTVEGWYEIPDLLAQRADSKLVAVLARVYFVFTVLVGGIMGLSLANAVFVDEMTSDNTDKLEEKLDQMLRMLEELKK